jgi:hypothetical protein
MLDLVLSWGVIVLPTLFALGLELVDEKIRKHPFWKYGVIAFGITLSALTFWQQSRAVKNAKKDQEEAIQRTAEKISKELAPKVAAETSGQVVGTLNREYGIVIGKLYQEIGALQTQQQSQFGLNQQQLALNYAPSLDLIYAGEQLQLWNRGKNNLYLWGNKYDSLPQDFDGKSYAIGPGSYYYLLTDKLKSRILTEIGQDGEDRVPLELYISTEDKKKYIVHAELWEVVKTGQITIHTQNHGYEPKDWRLKQP